MQDLRIEDTQTLHTKRNRRFSDAHVALKPPDFKGLRPHSPPKLQDLSPFLAQEELYQQSGLRGMNFAEV